MYFEHLEGNSTRFKLCFVYNEIDLDISSGHKKIITLYILLRIYFQLSFHSENETPPPVLKVWLNMVINSEVQRLLVVEGAKRLFHYFSCQNFRKGRGDVHRAKQVFNCYFAIR